MSTNTYYQDELQYLREVGPEFARANPEIARFMGDRGSDPDVERILEGVAFLCGRIRQKLDDELPELTANLMGLLWPHYLRPVPSMTIMELLPALDAMQAPFAVRRGAQFASIPIDGTRCRYRACWNATLRPWFLKDVRLETESARPVRLVLLLQPAAKAKLEDMELQAVRFHLTGELRTAFSLYLLLAAHLDRVTVSDGSERHDRPEFILHPSCVQPSGFLRAEAVLPYPPQSFAGYRLLQEYLVFKERFLFLDLLGLDRAVKQIGLTQTVEVVFTFKRRLESLPLVSRENVRLHCVPAVNLVPHPAEPVRLTRDRTEYLVQPAKAGVADRRHVEAYSVESVTGTVRTDRLEQHEYAPFYSFRHAAGDRRTATYYQTDIRPNVLGGDPRLGTDTYVSFVRGVDTRDLPADESVSIELVCTNRDLPSELRAGDIAEPTDSSPSGTRFRNIIKPTATIAPPLGKGLHWRLISHMALNYVTLIDADHFKELLRIYDFQAEHDAQRALAHQRMLDGILSLRSRFVQRMVRGAALRGSQVEMELNEDHFAGEGDAYLFATVVDRFLGLYVTLNSYSQLTVRFTKSGQIHAFPPRWGEQLTPAEGRETER